MIKAYAYTRVDWSQSQKSQRVSDTDEFQCHRDETMWNWRVMHRIIDGMSRGQVDDMHQAYDFIHLICVKRVNVIVALLQLKTVAFLQQTTQK